MKKVNIPLRITGAILIASLAVQAAGAQTAPREAPTTPRMLPTLPGETDPNRRMQPMPQSEWNAEQREAAEVYGKARKYYPGGGLFNDLLRVPKGMLSVFQLRMYVQNEISFGDRLSTIGMLVVLREWGQRQEFTGHAVEAVRWGIKPEIVHAIAEGSYPQGMDADESLIYDFCTELLRVHSVTDGTYDRMIKRFGERGVVEGMLLVNLYTMVAMDLNVVREPLPPGRPEMPDFPQTKAIPLDSYAKLPPLPAGVQFPAPRPASPPPAKLIYGQ